MFYFAPAWYSDKQGNFLERPWHSQELVGEFNASASQIRMFREAGEPLEILMFGYAPFLAGYLYRQNVYPVRCWSAFDTMQGIACSEIGILSYTDLPWPDGMEWIYTPNSILGFQGDKKYARVEIGENGRMIWIDYFLSNEEIGRRDYYDIRGFRSSSLHYRGGRPDHQEYYDPQGVRRFEIDWPAGEVKVHKAAAGVLKKERYASVSECINEVFRKKAAEMCEGDALVLAEGHMRKEMIQRIVSENAVGNVRVAVSGCGEITDVDDTERLLADEVPVYHIPLFDTKVQMGESRNTRDLQILFPTDGLEDRQIDCALREIFSYIEENPKAVLLPVSMRYELDREERVNEILRRYDRKLRVFSCRNENDLQKMLHRVRAIVDLRDWPDHWLQAAGISAGIPQICLRDTDYVKHGTEGYVIQDIRELRGALAYYLTGLGNWNRALVACLEKAKAFTGHRLVRQWKEALA